MKAVAKHHDCADKSYVGMILCNICQKPTSLLLDRRMKNSLCRNNFVPGEVCDECRNTHLKVGCMLLNPETGSVVVLKDEAVKRLIKDENLLAQTLAKRIAFTSEDVIQFIMNAPVEEQAPIIEGS